MHANISKKSEIGQGSCTLEPLAKVAGQLASMQTQAAWATLLVLQIAEARQLPDEIVPLILSSLPVPGAYPSMGS